MMPASSACASPSLTCAILRSTTPWIDVGPGIAIFLPFRSAIVLMFGSLAMSQRSPQSSGAMIFASTPEAQPTMSGPTPPAPIWMSPEIIPLVIAAPEASTFHENVVFGNCASSVCCVLSTISGA